MLDNNNLIGELDAAIWVNHWMATISEHPDIPKDEGAMIGWFANAIMAGYDKGREYERKRDIVERLNELAFQVAGAATRPLLEDHPNYVFPSERVEESIRKVLSEFGIPKGGY